MRKCGIVFHCYLVCSHVEFKECFSLYDKKRKGKIEAKDLITVMRCLGTSPTFNEVDRHLQVHKIGNILSDLMINMPLNCEYVLSTFSFLVLPVANVKCSANDNTCAHTHTHTHTHTHNFN